MNDLFDAAESQRRKDDGMAIAAEARPTDLELAKVIAFELANSEGHVHSDMVMKKMFENYGISTLGNAAGSLFKGKEWWFTGLRIKSERKSAHRRELKV